jgi:hypothetical protein
MIAIREIENYHCQSNRWKGCVVLCCVVLCDDAQPELVMDGGLLTQGKRASEAREVEV